MDTKLVLKDAAGGVLHLTAEGAQTIGCHHMAIDRGGRLTRGELSGKHPLARLDEWLAEGWMAASPDRAARFRAAVERGDVYDVFDDIDRSL